MSCDPFLVVAVDFGTTYSGFAFQFRHEYCAKDPTVISAPQSWSDGTKQVLSLKTPTALLLNSDLEIDSFGYEAERKYSNLCEENKHMDWYFYRRFKMKLQNRGGLSKTSSVEDESLKMLPAVEVFAKSIECLKIKLFEQLDKDQTVLSPDDILWVLTVPAIWDDSAKDFMRKAALTADIKNDNLKIALEPEAASLYCQYLPVNRFAAGGAASQFSLASPGTVYMVVDLGGGTADITCHEKLKDGNLREVHRACGGPWGGTAVDNNFIDMLSSIVGKPAMTFFMNNHRADYQDLMKEFEITKRNIELESDKPVNIKLPFTLFETVKNPRFRGKEFKQALAESKQATKIKLIGDKIKMNADLARSLVEKVADNIIKQMEDCFRDVITQHNLSLILMVGGFSESPYIQQRVRERFEGQNNIRVLIPMEAGLAVLKGAVVFGRQPQSISSRILRYTYGAEITPEWNPDIYDAAHRSEDGEYCNNVFKPFAYMDKEVEMGKKIEKTYNTIEPMQNIVYLKIFCSDKYDTKYTTEPECILLGTLAITVKSPKEEKQEIKVIYEFGNTELKVSGKEAKSGEICETVLQMNE